MHGPSRRSPHASLARTDRGPQAGYGRSTCREHVNTALWPVFFRQMLDRLGSSRVFGGRCPRANPRAGSNPRGRTQEETMRIAIVMAVAAFGIGLADRPAHAADPYRWCAVYG